MQDVTMVEESTIHEGQEATHKGVAYSYVRFSTVKQELGDSLRRQVEMAEAYCVKHELLLHPVSYRDLGVSAYKRKNLEKGALASFIEAVRIGKVAKGSYLVIEQFDRLSRADATKALRLLLDLVDAGIKVVTLVDEKVWDESTISDTNNLILAIVYMSRANNESESKSLRLAATASALRMAQRTLRRMREARLVLSAHGPDGSTLYALAEPGVRALRTLGVEAASGKDAMRGISGGYFRHRCVSNEIAIAGIVQGLRVSTEREVAQGLWAGVEAGIAGKRPDVLWRNRESWDWIEVQRSRPNARDYTRLLAWLQHMLVVHSRPGAQIAEGVRLRKIVFVCSTAFGARLLRDLREKKVAESSLKQLVLFSHSLYALDPVKFC